MQSGTDTVSYNYDLNKNMTSEVINNALTHSVTYNKHNSVKTAENKFGNAVHSSYSYEVLKNGNVSSVSETLAGASRQRAFDYDGIGRLTKETDGTNEISYTYDASGNRLTFDKTSLSQRSYGYLPGNISWYSTSNNAFAEYTHDNNGNILSKTGNRVTDYTMTYDGFNRLVSAAVEGGTSASYEYNGDGLRTAKTAKGTRTEFIWDGDRLVCEISGESVTVYKYGNRLFGFEKDGVKKYYNFNGHGDVTGITDSAYTLIKSYEYDAFGVEKNPDPADTNPFRYCAEYYDAETGYIYLRARYYDVKDGRFISEDPAKDGLNWYVYCGNNPVNFVDPFGLFDYNTKLSKSNHYSDDVKVLQNELAWWGYYKGAIDGYFGNQTLSAVNAYKNAKGLWNFGQYNGVVGVTTWESLGLIYRTKDDIAAGVEISMIELKQYKNFSAPINRALHNVSATAKTLNTVSTVVGFMGHKYTGKLAKGAWFLTQVYHKNPWDIKRANPWNSTIGANTYPGWNTKVMYNNNLMTPEELGNYPYGYIGKALGFNLAELYGGSWAAAGFPFSGKELSNEFSDWSSIKKGYNWY